MKNNFCLFVLQIAFYTLSIGFDKETFIIYELTDAFGVFIFCEVRISPLNKIAI